MHKMRRARRVEQRPFGAQVAFARVATGLAWTALALSRLARVLREQ
jgi:hypothetical protein